MNSSKDIESRHVPETVDGDRSVYLAGPVHFEDDGGHGWRNDIKENTDVEWEWVDPLDKYDTHATDLTIIYADHAANSHGTVSSGTIVREDKKMIRECDAVLVRWDDVAACGTPMEVLYADMLDVPVICWYVGDDLSPWMYHHADSITHSQDLALTYLRMNI